MKRILALTLALLMLLTLGACGKKEVTPEPTAEPTPAPTAEPTPEPTPTATPEPAWEPGYIRAGNLFVLWTTLQRGDEVTVLGQWEDYYIIEGEEANLLIEKRFLRPEGEEAPAEADGWARENTLVYPTGYLRGESIATLALNTEVRVIDTKAGWALIEWDGGSGYVDVENLSDQRIVYRPAGGGGGGGGPMDGTDVNMGDLSVVVNGENGVAKLGAYVGPEYEAFETCPGVILSKDTEAYLCIFLRGDEVKVTEVGEEECEIWVKDFFARIPRWAVRLEGDEEYTVWSAYAANKAVAYTEYQLRHELKTFNMNDRVDVVDELVEVELYVIEIDGEFGYMKLDDLSETAYAAYYGGGGGGGGGTPDWSIDVM